MGWDELREQRFDQMKKLGVIPEDTELSKRDKLVPAWENEANKAWQERRMEVYAAQIAVMDEGIGRILDELERTGRVKNTLLMLLVDNGGCHVEYESDRRGEFLNELTRDGRPVKIGNNPDVMPGPEDTWQSYGRGWANASNTPFRLFKQYDHEGGIRVPLIVHWPDVIAKGGQITHQTGHVTDILPTILEAASIEYPSQYKDRSVGAADGISLLPILHGEERIPHEVLFWEWAKGAATIKGKWKLVKLEENPWELYDLSKDPVEMHNLAESYPNQVNELSTLWKQWKQQEQ